MNRVMRVCEFCIRHGEGKKWYEVMQNYSAELYSKGDRENYARKLVKQTQTSVLPGLEKLIKLRKKSPSVYRYVRRIGTLVMKHNHFGQVIPIEDAEMIIEMVQSITRLPCICRSAVKGENNARFCIGIGIDPKSILADYPDLKANLETITREKAKELLRKFDREGLIHSVWTFKTPFIGAICNCDRDCLAYKTQVAADLMQVMFKSEYIAKIDPLRCAGCRNCQKLCQFGAIEYSSLGGNCAINPFKCYGCGVCRNACDLGLISIEEKGELPEAYRTW